MNYSWDDLKIFAAVAGEGGISRAAKSLKVNQSTVLRRIDQFEEELNLTLFIREKGSFQLTDAGKIVLVTARKMTEQAAALERQITSFDDDKATGEVVITGSDFIASHLLLPRIHKLLMEYPHLNIKFRTTNEFLNLADRDADIAIRLTDNPKEHLPQNLFGRRVCNISMCAYKGRHGDGLSWISWAENVDFNRWVSDNKFPALPIGPATDSVLAQVEAMKRGNFAAIIPCFVGDNDNALERLPGCAEFAGFEAWVLTHPDLKATKRIDTVMQFIGKVFSSI